jgi:hypothetical protein
MRNRLIKKAKSPKPNAILATFLLNSSGEVVFLSIFQFTEAEINAEIIPLKNDKTASNM